MSAAQWRTLKVAICSVSRSVWGSWPTVAGCVRRRRSASTSPGTARRRSSPVTSATCSPTVPLWAPVLTVSPRGKTPATAGPRWRPAWRTAWRWCPTLPPSWPAVTCVGTRQTAPSTPGAARTGCASSSPVWRAHCSPARIVWLGQLIVQTFSSAGSTLARARGTHLSLKTQTLTREWTWLLWAWLRVSWECSV